MKKKIYIHVGPGKTGSSAIQAWLHENGKVLEQSGVYYPHHSVSSNGISSGNRDIVLTRGEGYKWHVDKEKISTLLNEFESSSFGTLLLSSEYFFLPLMELAKLIPEAVFIFYLRNPLELNESIYNQGVKRRSFTHPFKVNEKLESRVNQLDELITKLGKKRFVIKSYDLAKSHPNGGLVGDFIALFGIEERVENITINPSYCLEALEFKRLINHFEVDVLKQKLDIILQDYRLGTQKYSFIPPEQFEQLKKSVCDEITALTIKHDISELETVVEHYKNTLQRPYKKQTVSFEEVNALVTYFKEVDIKFFEALKQTIYEQRYYELSNQYIYRAFGVTPQKLCLEPFNDAKLSQVFKNVNVTDKINLICDLANYYFNKKDTDNAQQLYKYALSLKPESKELYNKLAMLKYYPTAEKKRLANQHKVVRFKRFLKSLLPGILTQNS